jgi:hypothetical protein
MKILIEQPPNIEDIRKVFTINDTTVFTYKDTIYNPHNCPIDIPIMAHEEVHSRQQGEDPEGWWKKYLEDPVFRIEQEAVAYSMQYWMQCQFIKNRDTRALNLQRLAETLAGDMYGKMMTVEEAKKWILWKKPKTKKK